jgi:Hypoxia induced protein conserved region
VEYALRWILPFAVAAVAVVLVFGLINMLRGQNPNLSQKLMRARVLLQLLALMIIMAILYFSGNRPG